jgi:uncharacterized membrane protein
MEDFNEKLFAELRALLNQFESRIQKKLADLTQRVYRIETHLGINWEQSQEPQVEYQASIPLTKHLEIPQESIQQETVVSKPEEMDASTQSMDAPIPQKKEETVFFQTMEEEKFAPPLLSVQTRAPSFQINWETIIGGKWALWIGSLAVFLALAFFLAYTWQYLSPGMRLGLGFLTGLACLVSGEFSLEKSQSWFWEGLEGTGLGLLYLTTWAGTQVYTSFNSQEAYVGFSFITLLGILLALRHNSRNLSTLATFGGFLTPFLFKASLPAELLYIAILDFGILVLSLYKRWNALIWLSFLGTIFIPFAFLLFNSLSDKITCFYFFTLYYFIFLGASSFYSLFHSEDTQPEDLILLFSDTSAYSGAVYLLQLPSRFPAGFPLLLAAFYLAFAYFVSYRAHKNLLLRNTLEGMAIFFLTIAIPMQLHHGAIAIGWCVESALLISLGVKFKSAVYQKEGWIVWGFSAFATMISFFTSNAEPHLLFLNPRDLPLLFFFASTSWLAFYIKSEEEDPLFPFYAFFSVVSGAWLLAVEIYTKFSWSSTPNHFPFQWVAEALDFIAISWVIYSLLFILASLRFKNKTMQKTAEFILAVDFLLPFYVTFILVLMYSLWIPFFNLQFLAYLAIAGGIWAKDNLIQRNNTKELSEIKSSSQLFVGAILLWGVSAEIFTAFRFWNFPGKGSCDAGALFAIVSLWSFVSAFWFRKGLLSENKNLWMMGLTAGAIAFFGGLILSLYWIESSWIPFMNLRFLAFVSISIGSAFMAYVSKKDTNALGNLKQNIMGILTIIAFLAVLWGMTQETFLTFYFYQMVLGNHLERIAQMGVSLVWVLLGTTCLLAGVFLQYQLLRLLSLGLLGLTVMKVFLFDLQFLPTPYRVLSFGGLGLALIGISWLYSRFGKKIVGEE